MRIYKVFYFTREVMVLIFIHVMYFSEIGLIFFRGTVEGELFFPNFGDAVWNMIVFLSTTNFPDIMLPAVAKNRWTCLFFILYLLIGLFFLLNLILAIFYNHY
jgi:two pore calcium channel protein